MSQYNPWQPQTPRFSFGAGPMTPAVRIFIYACVAVFVLQVLYPAGIEQIHVGDRDIMVARPGLETYLGLVPAQMWSHLWLWQLVTFNFLHAGIFHIFLNLFVLWMFGTELEKIYGTRRFVGFMFVAGVGAGLTNALFMPHQDVPTIGASGIVYGALLAYAMNFPDRKLYLYFLVPVKAKWVVLGIGIISLISSVSGSQAGIAHIAHLGGMVFGYLYLRYDRAFFRLRDAYYRRKLKRMKKKFGVIDGDRSDKDDRIVH